MLKNLHSTRLQLQFQANYTPQVAYGFVSSVTKV